MKYKILELSKKANVTKRTIHYYISKGLLMPPEGTGVNSLYSDEHLKRLLLIKKLQSQYLPLNKIRDYILNHPNEEVESVEVETAHPEPLKENVYIKENISNVFELHYSLEQAEKYKYIIENVKKYVEKMLEN